MRVVAAITAIVVASFYRPVTFWTVNAWDLSSPGPVLLLGGALAVAGLWLLFVVRELGADPLVAGLTIACLVIVAVHWNLLVGNTGVLFVCGVLIAAWFANRYQESGGTRLVALVFLTAFGIVPLVQLVSAHFVDAQDYPLSSLPAMEMTVPTGDIEDIVVVIVDTYPNLHIARTWFNHDSSELLAGLEASGFQTPESSWSQHTYTALSVSSILSLHSVIEPGPTDEWGNRSSLWRLLRGDNLTSQTLESAGFTYTHVESGWAGTSCGPEVDRCVRAPWIDETVRILLRPTLAHDWVASNHFIRTGTFNTASALAAELPEVLHNNSHDYVFAHFLLPHDPVLVDESCTPIAETRFEQGTPELYRQRFAGQLACVDSLVSAVAKLADEDTAMLITGDHGSSTGQQLRRSPNDWTDADIAERFGVFMTYKLPLSCKGPDRADPMATLAAIMSCALDGTFDSPTPEYLIGLDDPVAVDPRRMREIKGQLAAGAIDPDQG